MSARFICDGCGREAPAQLNSMGDVVKPHDWYVRVDKDGRQDACSRACIQVVAAKTGKTSVVAPLAIAALLLLPFAAWAEDELPSSRAVLPGTAGDPQLSDGGVLPTHRLDQGPVLAPNPAPSPSPCDPSATVCYTVEKLVIGLRAWTPGEDPRDLAGGRAQLEVRYRRWRVQGRIDGTATAGTYRQGDLSTVRDVEAHAAGVWDALRLPGGVAVGPMAAVGGAVTLPEKGIRASLPRSITAVVGAAGSWPGGRIHVGVGAVHPLGRGIGAVCTWQLPLGERTSTVGMAVFGRRHVPEAAGVPAHSESVLLVWSGVAVRL